MYTHAEDLPSSSVVLSTRTTCTVQEHMKCRKEHKERVSTGMDSDRRRSDYETRQPCTYACLYGYMYICFPKKKRNTDLTSGSSSTCLICSAFYKGSLITSVIKEVRSLNASSSLCRPMIRCISRESQKMKRDREKREKRKREEKTKRRSSAYLPSWKRK